MMPTRPWRFSLLERSSEQPLVALAVRHLAQRLADWFGANRVGEDLRQRLHHRLLSEVIHRVHQEEAAYPSRALVAVCQEVLVGLSEVLVAVVEVVATFAFRVEAVELVAAKVVLRGSKVVPACKRKTMAAVRCRCSRPRRPPTTRC